MINLSGIAKFLKVWYQNCCRLTEITFKAIPKESYSLEWARRTSIKWLDFIQASRIMRIVDIDHVDIARCIVVAIVVFTDIDRLIVWGQTWRLGPDLRLSTEVKLVVCCLQTGATLVVLVKGAGRVLLDAAKGLLLSPDVIIKRVLLCILWLLLRIRVLLWVILLVNVICLVSLSIAVIVTVVWSSVVQHWCCAWLGSLSQIDLQESILSHHWPIAAHRSTVCPAAFLLLLVAPS